MSRLRIRRVSGLIFLVLLTFIGGCSSSKNENSPFSGGSHPSGWLPAGHMTSARSNIDTCIECHGSDLGGGISRVSCTSCHLGSATSMHPLNWSDAIMTKHGAYVAANTTSGCATADCHGSSLTGVTGSGPSCTSCHIGSATSVHPVSWGTGTQIALNHAPYVATNGNASCQNNYCHGSTLAGVAGSGPSCASCHLGGATSMRAARLERTRSRRNMEHMLLEHDQRLRDRNLSRNNIERGLGDGPSCTSCHIGGVIPDIQPTGRIP